MRFHLSTLALICAAGLIAPVIASAQDAAAPAAPAVTTTSDANGNQVVKYPPEYFAEFQVSSALDMVFHVPGFSFAQGEDVRGFAGAAGNVLIDGQRPASKSPLQETLGSISSAQVDHIELITGGAPGIDMQGYRQIVNVVRKQSDRATINFGGNIKFFPKDDLPAGFFSYASNKGGKTTDLYAEVFQFHDNGSNDIRRTIYLPDLSDALPDHMFIPQNAGGWGHQERFSHSRPFMGGKLSFNGNYQPIYYDYDAKYIQDGNTAVEHLDLTEIQSELGMQYEHKLGKSTTLNLNLLRRQDRETLSDDFVDGADHGEYSNLALSVESIVSAKLTWIASDKVTYKFGGEGAFNSRDNTSKYVQNGAGQNVPSDVVRVEEDRKEYFAIRNWQPTKTLSVETGLKVETSTISVKQENRSKSFVYPKPEVQIVWSPNDKTKLSWRTERVVGQLDFDDFASSVALDTAIITAGNPDVVPQKEWQNAFTIDRSFWGKGAVSLTLKHSTLQDTLDFAPIVTSEGVFNARSNIGEGTRDDIITSLTLPLDKLKVKGGELKIDYTRTFSSVTDPITGKSRPISGLNPDNYVINFSQNFPKHGTSWGVEIDSLNNATRYMAREQVVNKSKPWVALWAEYKTKSNITFGAVLQNVFGGRRDNFDRTVWDGLREQSPVVRVEQNVSIQRPFLILRVKKEM